MSNTIFAERLKEARNTRKLTQAQLYKMSGVATATISAYESSDGNKGKKPSLENTLKLARALGVSLDWLCGVEVSKPTVQITDFLKMLVKLDENITLSVDTVNLAENESEKVLPNACKEIKNSESYKVYVDIQVRDFQQEVSNLPMYDFDTDEPTDIGEPEIDYCVSTLTIDNIDINRFFTEWQKMRDLYKSKTIDENLYNLWLENQFEKIDKEQKEVERCKKENEQKDKAFLAEIEAEIEVETKNQKAGGENGNS